MNGSIKGKRRFIVAETAIAAWVIVETLTQWMASSATSDLAGGISMYGHGALVAIVVAFYGGDAAKAKFLKGADK